MVDKESRTGYASRLRRALWHGQQTTACAEAIERPDVELPGVARRRQAAVTRSRTADLAPQFADRHAVARREVDPLGGHCRAGVEADAPDRLEGIGAQRIAGVTDDRRVAAGKRCPAGRKIAEAGKVAADAWIGSGLRRETASPAADRRGCPPSRGSFRRRAYADGPYTASRPTGKPIARAPDCRLSETSRRALTGCPRAAAICVCTSSARSRCQAARPT
jgi:hypothetical protein